MLLAFIPIACRVEGQGFGTCDAFGAFVQAGSGVNRHMHRGILISQDIVAWF